MVCTDVGEMIRADDQTGVESGELDLVQLQLVGLHLELDAIDGERVPFREILEEHVVFGGKLGQGHIAGETDERSAGFGRRIARMAMNVQRAAGDGEFDLVLHVRLDGAEVEIGQGQLQVSRGRQQGKRSVKIDGTGFLKAQAQRGIHGSIADIGDAFQVEVKLVDIKRRAFGGFFVLGLDGVIVEGDFVDLWTGVGNGDGCVFRGAAHCCAAAFGCREIEL